MDGLQFLRPLWLLALGPLVFLLIRLWRRPNTLSPWSRAVDPHLLPHLLTGRDPRSVRRSLLWLGLAWLLGVLALAGPSWQQLPPLQYRPEVPPLVIALDLSRSMTTRDLHPSRLAVAKAKLHQLLQRLPPRPVALLVYSAGAHRALPFTDDRRLLQDSLRRMTPELMPARGSQASAALLFAAGLFNDYQARGGDLLLVTDAVDPGAPAAARRLAQQGRRLSILAVGTEAGGPVPDGDGGYLRSTAGPVIAPLKRSALEHLAEAGGGSLQLASADDSDLSALLRGFGQPRAGGGELNAGEGKVRHDGGPWLIPPLLLLALWMFRRGSTLVLLLALGLHDSPAMAWSWNALWLNADQRAMGALQDGWPEQAAAVFTDPRWQGVALFRHGDYQAALQRFEQDPSATGHYNRGTALVYLGRLKEASQAYRAALGLDPAHEDAAHNLALVQKALESGGPAPAIEALERPEQSPGAKKKKGKQAAQSAEKLLDEPRDKDMEQPWGDTERGLQRIGSIGGGAMLMKGGSHPDLDESSSIGQGMNEGDEAASGEDRVARRSGKLDGKGGDSAAERTAPSHLPRPQREPAKSDQTTGGAAVMPSADDAPAQDEQEQPARSLGSGSQPEPTGNGGEQTGPGAARQETLQALRHWVDGIEDNPGGLLKEKFRRDYQRRAQGNFRGDPW